MQEKNKKKKISIIIICVLLLFLIAGVSILIILLSKNKSSEPIKITKPVIAEQTYTGNNIDVTTLIDSNVLKGVTITGETIGKEVKDYAIVLTLKNNYIWSDNSTSPFTIVWKIVNSNIPEPTKVTKPSVSTTKITYNKAEHQVNEVLIGFDSNKMEFDSTSKTTATNAGTYTVVIKLKENYIWEDLSESNLTLNWTISKVQINGSWDESDKYPVFEISDSNFEDIIVVKYYDKSNNEVAISNFEEETDYTAVLTLTDTVNYEFVTGIETTKEFTTPKELVQYSIRQDSLNYNESIAKIDNPDQGFYYPIIVRIDRTGTISSASDNILTNPGWDGHDYNMYHLRFDISDLKDCEFSESVKTAFKNAITTELDKFKEKGKNVVVRFAYHPNYGEGTYTSDANFDLSGTEDPLLIKHVKAICEVLVNFDDVITAVEAGMLGQWGEMTSGSEYMDTAHYSKLINTFLEETGGTNLKVLARTPRMIYDLIGYSDLDVFNNKPVDFTNENLAIYKRLGLYNDSFLANWNNLGTYTFLYDGGTQITDGNNTKAVQVEFLKQFTANSAFGGETVKYTSFAFESVFNDACLVEMEKLGLNYLNGIYHQDIINFWKNETYTGDSVHSAGWSCETDELYYNQTSYNYIQNHLGYRLVLKNSVFEYTNKYDELTVKLNIQNVGFGNFNKTKNLKLMFVNESGETVYQNIVKEYNGENEVTLKTNLNLANGNYKVYLCICSGNTVDNSTYCVQFANEGANSWNSTLNANLVGQIQINK